MSGAVTKQTYAGLFMVTLSTLMYEILLTRIFSVTMWYHFAFMAISIAMFGMTVGAVLVYLMPSYFVEDRVKERLALSSLLFSVSIVLSFLTHLSIPFNFHPSITGLFGVALNYFVIATPFIFSGISVCLVLTKFPNSVSRLYAADLVGAAFGCVLLVYLLDYTDGPTAVIVVAFLAGIGAWCFAADSRDDRLRKVAVASSLLLAAFAVTHTVLVPIERSLLPLLWVKGSFDNVSPLYERWNSFSRIRVFRVPGRLDNPVGWGLSRTYKPDPNVSFKQLGMNIDATAGTVLTEFTGDLNNVAHLKYDVTNIAHYLRSGSRVLVIGTGGGRDVLSALAFNQASILGVEMNPAILEATNQVFGELTGHLDRNPKVTFVRDEARSYIARQTEHFDLIQISLIDTWAATAAGAFVLAENSLYTVEAWELFLRRLAPKGILTVSRWYFKDRPAEVYRLTSLATASLLSNGITDPRAHIAIVRSMRVTAEGDEQPEGVGTILVSRDPFSVEDLAVLEDVARRMQFDIVLSPTFALDKTFETIAAGHELTSFTAKYPLNITPPTDDSPFFFNMLRLRDMLNAPAYSQGQMSMNVRAVSILGMLLLAVTVLTVLCVILPLMLTTKTKALKGATPLFVFFAAIGAGFMLIEVSQMQRLIVFLGTPTYGLTVVLFTLLLSSGLGSALTQGLSSQAAARRGIIYLLLLVLALLVFGVVTPRAIDAFRGSTTPVRIAIAAAILSPLGVLMGVAFPIGMKLASIRSESLTPWFWGLNGATSVWSSVFAIAIALSFSISTSFWLGFGCYIVACLAFAAARASARVTGVSTVVENASSETPPMTVFR